MILLIRFFILIATQKATQSSGFFCIRTFGVVLEKDSS